MPADMIVWAYVYGSIAVGLSGYEVLLWTRRRAARRASRAE